MKFRDLEAGMYLQQQTPVDELDGLFVYDKNQLYVYFVDLFHKKFDQRDHAHQLYHTEWDGGYYDLNFSKSTELQGVVMALFEREGLVTFLAKEFNPK